MTKIAVNAIGICLSFGCVWILFAECNPRIGATRSTALSRDRHSIINAACERVAEIGLAYSFPVELTTGSGDASEVANDHLNIVYDLCGRNVFEFESGKESSLS